MRRAIKKGVETRGLIIEVLYCFHQNNDDSKCEVAHTSPPVSRFKVRYPNFARAGDFNATRVGAGLAAVAIGFGLNSATSKSTKEISISNPTPTPAISISEIHNQLHLESLPED